jgi:hypothetical protein
LSADGFLTTVDDELVVMIVGGKRDLLFVDVMPIEPIEIPLLVVTSSN